MTSFTQENLANVIKAYDVRGVVGETLTPELVRSVAEAFAYMMREEGASAIVIGHDMRDSSPELSQIFADGVNAQGLDAVKIGLCSTDELYFASGYLDCPGAMFTASHNPAKYNGIKLCRAGARPVGEESGLKQITRMVIDGVPEYDGALGTQSEQDVLEAYGDYLNKLVPLGDIRPLKVAVDAGNGMGGYTVPSVLSGLPLDIQPLYFELDGNFPNHEANPLDPKNLVDLQKYTVETGSDIGIAFDGDADRCFIVDEKGNAVSPSTVAAMIAKNYLEVNPGATIIHNLITSKALPEIVEELGGTPVRTRVGHSFIKQEMAESGAIFGGEHSAHYYFSEFFNADSGMLAAMHVLKTLGTQDKPLSELKKEYERYTPSGEINSEVDDQEKRITAVLDAFKDQTETVDTLDGVTVQLKDTPAWFNVRASNTEPLLRLNAEGTSPEETQEIVDKALQAIRD